MNRIFKQLVVLAIWFFAPLGASLRDEVAFSRASSAAQHGNWQEAQSTMRSMLVDAPDRDDLLYDLGVCSFEKKEFEQAKGYFQKVVGQIDGDQQLKKQARFNLANTFVELKKLEDAIAQYEEILKDFPDDERARHNLEIVKKMLEQQKQQEQQQKQNEKNKDQEKDQQSEEDKSDQSEQSESGKQDKQDQQRGESNQDNTSDQTQNDEQNGSSSDQKQEGTKQDTQGGSHDQDRQQEGAGQDKNQSQKKQKGDNKPQSPRESHKPDHQSQDRTDQERQHDKIPQEQKGQESTSHDKKGVEKSQGMRAKEAQTANNSVQLAQQNVPELPKEDQWILGVLDTCEQNDEKANKRIIKSTIDKKLAGTRGQNCW